MIQLAKELGLSVSTVSKAIGDSHEISASTKKRVLELAKKYKYKRAATTSAQIFGASSL